VSFLVECTVAISYWTLSLGRSDRTGKTVGNIPCFRKLNTSVNSGRRGQIAKSAVYSCWCWKGRQVFSCKNYW